MEGGEREEDRREGKGKETEGRKRRRGGREGESERGKAAARCYHVLHLRKKFAECLIRLEVISLALIEFCFL